MEPRTRKVPVASHCVFGYVQHTSDLLVAESAEVPQLDDVTSSRIHLSQSRECFVQTEYFRTLLVRDYCNFFQRDLLRSAAPFCIRVAACVIDENSSHYLCRDGEEMRTIRPVNISLIDEADVGFVNEGSSL